MVNTDTNTTRYKSYNWLYLLFRKPDKFQQKDTILKLFDRNCPCIQQMLSPGSNCYFWWENGQSETWSRKRRWIFIRIWNHMFDSYMLLLFHRWNHDTHAFTCIKYMVSWMLWNVWNLKFEIIIIINIYLAFSRNDTHMQRARKDPQGLMPAQEDLGIRISNSSFLNKL